MKNLTAIEPVITDAITGAFGGAVIGDFVGGYTIAVVGALLGALFVFFCGIRALRKEKAHQKEEQRLSGSRELNQK